MLKFFLRHKGIMILLLGMLIIIGSLGFDVRYLCAHSPHDNISALALSPAYSQDQTLFIVIGDHALKSIDGGGSWKQLIKGLDNKFVLSSLDISSDFDTDQTVFLSSKGDGIYKSQDGGGSWYRVNHGLSNLGIDLLIVSPSYRLDKIVLAAGIEGGLYKTNNGGEDWSQIISNEVRVTAIAFSSDSKKKFIAVGDNKGNIWFSENGDVWNKRFQLPESGSITTIAISEKVSEDQTLFVGTAKKGLFKTVDEGASFVALEDGPSQYSLALKDWRLFITPPDPHMKSLILSSNYHQDHTIFASTWYEAVFESHDGGESWQRRDIGISCDSQANSKQYKSPHFNHLKISKNFLADQTIFLAGFDGLFKSANGGENWTQLETMALKWITGMGISPAVEGKYAITVSTYGGGAYTTNDQGRTWAINNKGLKTTRLVDVAFSPAYGSDQTVFSGASGALLKSQGQTGNWLRIELRGAERRSRPYPTFIALSPNFATDQTMYFGTRRDGVYKSTDGGLNSTVIWDGLGNEINALVISPDFLVDGILFASIRRLGIYKTEDRGETWQSANHGLPFIATWKAPLPIVSTNMLLVISPNYKEDKTLFAGSAGAEGLFKTTDGGMNWEKLAEAAYGSDGRIIGIGISPNYKHDNTLIISVKGKGLFKSTDKGQSFTEIGQALINANHPIALIVFSPLYISDKTIYGLHDENIFRSTDVGESWKLISRPVRYENMRDVVQYEGRWRRTEGERYSAISITQSEHPNNHANLRFVGTGVSWIGTTDRDQGIANVYIDGNYVAKVDQFSHSSQSMVTSFSMANLDSGWHTIMIEVSDLKNPASTGHRITIDAFDVAP